MVTLQQSCIVQIASFALRPDGSLTKSSWLQIVCWPHHEQFWRMYEAYHLSWQAALRNNFNNALPVAQQYWLQASVTSIKCMWHAWVPSLKISNSKVGWCCIRIPCYQGSKCERGNKHFNCLRNKRQGSTTHVGFIGSLEQAVGTS